MLLFASKKVFATACQMYRNLWENAEKIEFERMNPYNNYLRLSGYINGKHYQVHITSAALAARINNYKYPIKRDNDTEIIRIFAVACACADYGQFFTKFEHLTKELVLNY